MLDDEESAARLIKFTPVSAESETILEEKYDEMDSKKYFITINNGEAVSHAFNKLYKN